MIRKLFYVALTCGLVLSVMSCENQKFNDETVDVDRVHVATLSEEMQKVRDYVPEYAVMAHRGSTFWTPEETEAAYRWAREIGADYLECDLQVSKDGVVLALHDTDLKRTTNIADVFGEVLPTKLRKEYYQKLGYTTEQIDSLVLVDRQNFVPNYPSSYTYYELMHLDAGTWFNQTSLEQARAGFTEQHQYISTLEDLVMYSKGFRLKRFKAGESDPFGLWQDPVGERVVTGMEFTGKSITNPINFVTVDKVVKYNCEYEMDADVNGNPLSGNIPGIYIEFKEPWLNPSGFEQMVYEELEDLNMNIITAPASENEPFYKDGKVNVGNTNGKVVLQTFSLQSLVQVSKIFQGKVPMCFLLWLGNGATDLTYDDPTGYASFINLAVQYKAHYIGPCISGAPNNYPELNRPWQNHLIHRAKMKNHPYTFDTYDQMAKYFGQYNYGVEGGELFKAPYLDALFTNHSDMSLQYMIDFNWRSKDAPQTVPDARQLLKELGYEK